MKRVKLSSVLVGLILVGVMLVYAFPVYWMLVTAFKSQAELYAYPPTLVPRQPTFQAFSNVLIEKGYTQLIKNSLAINSLTVLLTLALALLINYPIVRMRVPAALGQGVLDGVLAIRFLPGIVVIIPIYAIVRGIGLYDNIFSLVLVYTAFSLPLAVYMLNGFLREAPLELEEAALVDGATKLRAFVSITLPMLAPALLAIAVLTFALSWNEFLFALILTATPIAQTFAIGVWRLVSQFQILWNEMAAVGVIAILLPILLLVFARRYVISALTFGVIRDKA